jgi:hypothetical protein
MPAKTSPLLGEMDSQIDYASDLCCDAVQLAAVSSGIRLFCALEQAALISYG